MKKKALSLIIALMLLSVISVIAIDLEVSPNPVSNVFVIELDEPAVFDLTIKNLGEEETFSVYSLVGVNITHNPFILKNEETKNVRVYLTPQDHLRKNPRSYTFEYKIKNSLDEIYTDTLTISLVDLESSFLIEPESISPNSEMIVIDIRNNLMKEFRNVEFKLNSPFFSKSEKISFRENEKKFIEVELDKEKLKTMDAGNYILNSQITVDGKITNVESQMKFLEKEGIETVESDEGIIMKRTEIVKKNTGNVKKVVKITLEKSLLEFLFTTMNVAPTETKTEGFIKTYTWEKVLIPNEEFKVVTRTNWLFPIFILIIILIGARLIRRSIYDSLELTKKVSFVKTKGGQFALKVTVKAKAKKNLEKITVVDRIPPLVKLYEKFGVIAPDKIDLENRKLHWNLNLLNKDETRIFTYIIYSKIGVVGRFELPEAKAVYEEDGELKEAISNRSFYFRD